MTKFMKQMEKLVVFSLVWWEMFSTIKMLQMGMKSFIESLMKTSVNLLHIQLDEHRRTKIGAFNLKYEQVVKK